MKSAPKLCVGGPLDGQHRTVPDDAISFRVINQAQLGVVPVGRVSDDSIEYQLIWSGDHGRMVWWAKEGEGGRAMNVDKIMELCWLRGGSKDLERLASLIAIQNAKIAESPKRCMEMMSKRSVELQMVLEDVDAALNGLDENNDPVPWPPLSIPEVEAGRNAKARRILREWHRRTDNHSPIQPEDSQ